MKLTTFHEGRESNHNEISPFAENNKQPQLRMSEKEIYFHAAARSPFGRNDGTSCVWWGGSGGEAAPPSLFYGIQPSFRAPARNLKHLNYSIMTNNAADFQSMKPTTFHERRNSSCDEILMYSANNDLPQLRGREKRFLTPFEMTERPSTVGDGGAAKPPLHPPSYGFQPSFRPKGEISETYLFAGKSEKSQTPTPAPLESNETSETTQAFILAWQQHRREISFIPNQ